MTSQSDSTAKGPGVDVSSEEAELPAGYQSRRERRIEAAQPVVADKLPVLALITLAAAGFVTMMSEMMTVGLQSDIKMDLGIQDAQVGAFVGVFALGTAGAAVPITALTRTQPRKSLLIGLMLIFLITTGITAFTSNFPLIMASRLIAGMSAGVVWAMLAGYAVALSPTDKQGSGMAIAMAGTPLALAFGIPAGTFLGGYVGWQGVFQVMAAVVAVLMVLMVLVLQRVPGEPRRERRSVADVVMLPGMRTVVVTTLLFCMGHMVGYNYLQNILSLADQVNDTVDNTARFQLVFGAAAAAGLYYIGAKVDKRLRSLIWQSCLVLAVSMTALGFLWSNLAVVYVTVFLWGLSFGGTPTLLQTASALNSGTSRDVGQALIVTTWNGAVALASAVGGIIVSIGQAPHGSGVEVPPEDTGIKYLMWVCAGLAVAALLLSCKNSKAFLSMSDRAKSKTSGKSSSSGGGTTIKMPSPAGAGASSAAPVGEPAAMSSANDPTVSLASSVAPPVAPPMTPQRPMGGQPAAASAGAQPGADTPPGFYDHSRHAHQAQQSAAPFVGGQPVSGQQGTVGDPFAARTAPFSGGQPGTPGVATPGAGVAGGQQGQEFIDLRGGQPGGPFAAQPGQPATGQPSQFGDPSTRRPGAPHPQGQPSNDAFSNPGQGNYTPQGMAGNGGFSGGDAYPAANYSEWDAAGHDASQAQQPGYGNFGGYDTAARHEQSEHRFSAESTEQSGYFQTSQPQSPAPGADNPPTEPLPGFNRPGMAGYGQEPAAGSMYGASAAGGGSFMPGASSVPPTMPGAPSAQTPDAMIGTPQIGSPHPGSGQGSVGSTRSSGYGGQPQQPTGGSPAISTGMLLMLEETLSARVVGQDDAVRTLAGALRRFRVDGDQRVAPLGSFLVVGPPGVGRTELLEALAEALYGSTRAIVRVQLGHMPQESLRSHLVGNSQRPGVLSEQLAAGGNALIILDNPEHGPQDTSEVLREMLTQARVSHPTGGGVDLRGCVLVLTRTYNSVSWVDSNPRPVETKQDALASLARYVGSDVTSRLDDVVQLQSMTPQALCQFSVVQTRRVVAEQAGRSVDVQVTQTAQQWMARRCIQSNAGVQHIVDVTNGELREQVARTLAQSPGADFRPLVVDVAEGTDGLAVYRQQTGQPSNPQNSYR